LNLELLIEIKPIWTEEHSPLPKPLTHLALPEHLNAPTPGLLGWIPGSVGMLGLGFGVGLGWVGTLGLGFWAGLGSWETWILSLDALIG
jgi:hypothetical protein